MSHPPLMTWLLSAVACSSWMPSWVASLKTIARSIGIVFCASGSCGISSQIVVILGNGATLSIASSKKDGDPGGTLLKSWQSLA